MMPEFWDLVLRATLILAVGQILALALSRAPAGLRVMILRLTLAGCLAACLAWLFGLKVGLPLLPPEPAWTPAAVTQSSSVGLPVLGQEIPSPQPKPQSLPWMAILWASGASVLGLGLLLSWGKLAKLKKEARPLPGQEDQQVLAEAAGQDVDLARQHSLSTALTFGLLSHTVLVPDAFQNWAEGSRRSVLLHEAAHIRRFDCAWNSLALAFRAVFWFHPLAWTLAWAHRQESELAADEWAIAKGVPALQYAEALLALARNSVPGGKNPQGALSMSTHPLGRRIRAALRPARRISTWGAFSLAAVTGAAFIAAAAAFAAPAGKQEVPGERAASLVPTTSPYLVDGEENAPVLAASMEEPEEVIRLVEGKRSPRDKKAELEQLKRQRDALKAKRDALRARAKSEDPQTQKMRDEVEKLRKEVESLQRRLSVGDTFELALPGQRLLPPRDMNRLAPGVAEIPREEIERSYKILRDLPKDLERQLAPLKGIPKVEMKGDVLFIDGERIALPRESPLTDEEAKAFLLDRTGEARVLLRENRALLEELRREGSVLKFRQEVKGRDGRGRQGMTFEVPGRGQPTGKVEIKGGVITFNGAKVGEIKEGEPIEVTVVNGVVTVNGQRIPQHWKSVSPPRGAKPAAPGQKAGPARVPGPAAAPAPAPAPAKTSAPEGAKPQPAPTPAKASAPDGAKPQPAPTPAKASAPDGPKPQPAPAPAKAAAPAPLSPPASPSDPASL